MATRARDVSPLTLPVRSRAAQAHNGNIPAKLTHADRIADPPGIQVADQDPVNGSRQVGVIVPAATPRATWFDGLPLFSRTNLQ